MLNFKKNKIGKEEIFAAKKVLKTGDLSNFVGEKHKDFYGGFYVKKFEKELCKFYKSQYAVTVNSWTSGLMAIFGAFDFKRGDEIILPPWTMTACMSSILNSNLVPIFCDIEKETFNIDPKIIKKKISKKTRAILGVDIFGHPVNIPEIRKICKKYNLKFILDCAQSPFSKYKGKFSSQYADVSGYSFNYHKHISTGEGGVILTNNKDLARRLQLIRNHGEVVVSDYEIKNHDVLGFNFRMGEIEAAIGIQQLKKLEQIVNKKNALAKFLNNYLKKFKGIILPTIKKNYTHSYYVYAMKLDRKVISLKKNKLLSFIKKNKLPIGIKYNTLYKANVLKNKKFLSRLFDTKKEMNKYISKNKESNFVSTESLQNNEYFGIGLCNYDYDIKDLKKIFKKLYLYWKKNFI